MRKLEFFIYETEKRRRSENSPNWSAQISSHPLLWNGEKVSPQELPSSSAIVELAAKFCSLYRTILRKMLAKICSKMPIGLVGFDCFFFPVVKICSLLTMSTCWYLMVSPPLLLKKFAVCWAVDDAQIGLKIRPRAYSCCRRRVRPKT